MKTITILSLGAGVQSTALALMAERGMVDKPTAAIFADTGDEPESIYRHLDWIQSQVSFPIYRVKEGGGLGADFLAALKGERVRASQPPFFVRQDDMSAIEIEEILSAPEPKLLDFLKVAETTEYEVAVTDPTTGEELALFGVRSEAEELFNNAWRSHQLRRDRALNKDQGGMLWRACTRDYKIIPIRRKVRQLMIEHGADHVHQQIGISTDERQREAASGVRYITNTHPLLEQGWSRQQIEKWLFDQYGIKVPKSACIYCPYRSNAGWRYLKIYQPDVFESACQFDEAIRDSQGKKIRGAGITGQLYVHRSFTPLRTADFEEKNGEFDFGFEQECDGMCGH